MSQAGEDGIYADHWMKSCNMEIEILMFVDDSLN